MMYFCIVFIDICMYFISTVYLICKCWHANVNVWQLVELLPRSTSLLVTIGKSSMWSPLLASVKKNYSLEYVNIHYNLKLWTCKRVLTEYVTINHLTSTQGTCYSHRCPCLSHSIKGLLRFLTESNIFTAVAFYKEPSASLRSLITYKGRRWQSVITL